MTRKKPYTNYKHILEIDLKDPQIRLFMYDVDDRFYGDDFFYIYNINPSNAVDLNHWLNVLDISDRLVSKFAVTPTNMGGFQIPRNTSMKELTRIIKDKEYYKVIKQEVKGNDGFPVRHYRKERVIPGLVPARMIPVRTNVPNKNFITSFEKQNRNGDIVSRRYVGETDRNKVVGDVNPTTSYHIKTQVRNSPTPGEKIIEFISIKLKDLQREERDGNNNIIKPMIPPIWREDIIVNYNPQKREIELDPTSYEFVRESAIYAGSSPQYNTNSALLEMQAYLDAMGTDNVSATDIAKKATEFVKELAKSRNSKKIINEKGEEIDNKGKAVK